MSKDLVYLSVHFSHPSQVQFMEDWKNYHVPFDEIDTAQLFQDLASILPQFLLEEEEDGAIPLSLATFSSKVNKNKSSLRQPVWTDLGTDQLRSDAKTSKLPDQTILKPLHSAVGDDCLTDFLSNGYNAEFSVLANDNFNVSDSWLNMTSDFPVNHTFSNVRMRSTSGPHRQPSDYAPLQTPQVGRTRQMSLEKYQTPIRRIGR